MSLYGNVKKIGSASFQFDRKYNNRKQMDDLARVDGVYAGRYVLVEYGERFSQNTDSEQSEFNLIETEDTVRVEGVTENQEFKNNAAIDLRTYGAVYDSTVWQKIYINENGVGVDKYVMVAELNAIVPKLEVSQDAPLQYPALNYEVENYRTKGIVTGKINERRELEETVRLTNTEEIYAKPHFDTALDTELTYLLHWPTALNLELGNDTIDFNENGFNIAYSYPESQGISAIAWIPKGHDEEGNEIYLNNYLLKPGGYTDNAGNPYAILQQGTYNMDTKVLFMSFPALGNAMNGLYNLIYGKPDPNDSLELGAMRPYFKRFIDKVEMTNHALVKDPSTNKPQEVTYIDNTGALQYFTLKGKVGETVSATTLNWSDIAKMHDLEPSNLVELGYLLSDGHTYYPLDSAGYSNLPKNEQGVPTASGQFVVWEKLHNPAQPLTMTIHIPTGNEDPDLAWLKKIPALADILSNNDAGLATVLSSLFNTVDPLTGTVKYFLHNDWTMSSEDGSSGPSIINKPKTVGGYKQEFRHVLTDEDVYNAAGDRVYETPGYMWDFSSLGIETIDYPHTEIVTSPTFSSGSYKINFNTWQLVDYTVPNINWDIAIFDNSTATSPPSEDTIWSNQTKVLIQEHGDITTFINNNGVTLSNVEVENQSGKLVAFDLDTGFNTIQHVLLNDIPLTDVDENTMIHSYGLDKGHVLIWMDTENINQTIKLSAAGFNDATFILKYNGS